MNQNAYLVPGSIVIAGAFVASAIYFGGSTGSPQGTGNANAVEAAPSGEIAPLTERDHIRGSSKAELVIYEYSDTECPFCKVFHNTMKEVLSTYNGQVAWVYRHFPIAQLHSKATKEAE